MGHPAHWTADVVLSDGGTARLRPITRDDRDAYARFYAGVSDTSKYLRYLQPHPTLSDAELDRITAADQHDEIVLVLELRDEIIAAAQATVLPGVGERTADVAFLVNDDQQGRGIAHLLLEHLAACGRERGVRRFVADMLPENRRMLRVFNGAGYTVRPERVDDLIAVDFDLTPTDSTRAEARRRHLRSQSAAMHRLLHPGSVTVVGPRDRLQPWVDQLRGGFAGTLREVLSEPGDDRPVGQLLASTGDTDLVVTTADFGQLEELLAVAALHQAHAVVALADVGTRPMDPDQAHQLVAWARTHDVRVLGPESLGMISTEPSAPLNLTPAPPPRRGSVGVFGQSAGVSTLALGRALSTGLGISSFLSTGLIADVSGNDVLRFWGADDATSVVMLALDTIGNPRTFHRVLRRVAASKTVVLFAPARALRHVTSASEELPRMTEDGVLQVMRQAGAVVVTRRDTLVDVARIAARQPVPRGRRVALVTNAGRLGEQLRLAAARFGLEAGSTEVVHGLDAPDLLAEAALRAARSGDVDAVVVAAVEVAAPLLEDVHARLQSVARADTGVPIVGILLGLRHPDLELDADDRFGDLPDFDNYGEALEALALLAAAQPHRGDAPPPAAIDRNAVDRVIDDILSRAPDGREATASECMALLEAIGIVGTFKIDGGAHVRVRGIEDAVLGPAVSVGVAVVPSEVFKDQAWRVPPLDVDGASAMLDSLTARPLLDGLGDEGRRTIADAIARVAAAKDSFPELVDLRIELTAVGGHLGIIDVRAHLLPLPERDAGARRVD